MLSAFEQLGVRADASEQDIRAAYHSLVKAWHPDKFQNPDEQAAGQTKLIGINLAYEQAMKIAGTRRKPASAALPLEQAKNWARKLLERKQFELALLQLGKSEGKDAEWYALQGQALGGTREFISSHQAWRAAVRMEPDNLTYRRGALEAEMRLRREGDFAHKAMDQVRSIFRRKNPS